jgi:hypothetical protein
MPDILNIPLLPEESDLLEAAARSSRLSLVQWAKVAMLKAARPPVAAKPPKPKPGEGAWT